MPAFLATSHLREPVNALVRRLQSSEGKRVAVIYDSMVPWVVQDVPSIPNAKCYCFNSVSVFAIYAYYWEAKGKPAPPGGEILESIPSLEYCFTPEFWEFWKMQEQFMSVSSGGIHNSSKVIEGFFFDLLLKEEGIMGGKNQWAIGPFNPVVVIQDSNNLQRHQCLDWLDKQEENSVLFVSFGSSTSLPDEQILELAIGLEKSQQKFIWVMRDADKGDVFTGKERTIQLPEGYEDSIQGRGIIIRDWAPQLEILAHPSTGGFMSHCGWNSCMESISMGVPMAAWPMHSDQPRNSVLITKILKVGLPVRDWGRRDEIVTSDMIHKAVEILMDSAEGEEVRRRAAELGGAVKKSVVDGGVTRAEMDSFVAHICS